MPNIETIGAIGAVTGGVIITTGATIFSAFKLIYKRKKIKLYKSIDKSVNNINYKTFSSAYIKLKMFDLRYNKNKCEKIKRKYRFNDEIVENKEFFMMSLDPELMVRTLDRKSKNINDDIFLDRETELNKREHKVRKNNHTLNKLEKEYQNILDEKEKLQKSIH